MILFSHKSNPFQSSPDVSGGSDLRGEEKEGQYLMVVHTSKPSSGLVPAVLPPASFTKVGSQSEMWMSSRVFTPFRFSKGLATKPTARTPPSHRLHFLPRRGQLLPPAKVCPPLSETQSGHSVRTSLMTRHVQERLGCVLLLNGASECKGEISLSLLYEPTTLPPTTTLHLTDMTTGQPRTRLMGDHEILHGESHWRTRKASEGNCLGSAEHWPRFKCTRASLSNTGEWTQVGRKGKSKC